MELQTDVRINSNAEVIVHDDHTRLILRIRHRPRFHVATLYSRILFIFLFDGFLISDP